MRNSHTDNIAENDAIEAVLRAEREPSLSGDFDALLSLFDVDRSATLS